VRNQIDAIDIVALIVLPLAAGIKLGVWTLSLDVFGTFDFGQALVSFGEVDISIAFIATLASIGTLVAQGQLSQGDYKQEEWYLIAGSMAIVPIYVFVPLVQDLFAMSDIIPLVVWLALSVSSVYISYKA
jgi:hypothetical protein